MSYLPRVRQVVALSIISATAVVFSGCGKESVPDAPDRVDAAAPADAAADTLSPEAAQLARGEYLARHVAMCIDCHSTRDDSIYASPLVPGTEGGGGERFPGPFGLLVAPNITPTGIGDWTDDQLHAAIVRGERPDGTHIFPLMPWPGYSHMTDADVRAIIAYIRTLKPLDTQPPASEIKAPVEEMVKHIPTGPAPSAVPDPADIIAYGRYMTTAAACFDCHTQQGPQGPMMDQAFAGGLRFDLPRNPVVSANITPHATTGIGAWSEEQFIQRFHAYRDGSAAVKLTPKSRTTIMPWAFYSQMTDQDLKAIYAYLQSLPPIDHAVVIFPEE